MAPSAAPNSNRELGCRSGACCISACSYRRTGAQRGSSPGQAFPGMCASCARPARGRERPHAVAARLMRRHQAVDVTRQLGAAALVRRLELRRYVGALFAPERDQPAAEADLLALIACERGAKIVAMG